MISSVLAPTPCLSDVTSSQTVEPYANGSTLKASLVRVCSA